MFHPLAEDLTQLSDADLSKKYNELSSKLAQAYRFGQSAMVGQIQLLLQDYQNELNARQRKQLDDMMSKSDKFNKIIDIK